ncbi:MAG TPA: DUF167 domain-containing protein [Syntrophales bacterium]|nr:DUF167 domain-containing protein [Syntrophales bacterium]HPX11970.1 DUF167 domain-containing protein [Syntrophales bacterium]HQB31026.1 DUF167 domain-containing protein [Syntrophales bacterium]HQN79279.1 DUF167 domain-containing protein [Syntrophales bacterium]HQQ26428.1 DUF167 domain-containing protein [Syntrophales bacterium]
MNGIPVTESDQGIVFQVRVVPRSSRSEVAGIQDDALKVRLKSPPVEGKANEECVRFLAGLLGVKRDRVRILSGLKSKTKTVAVSGVKKKDLETAVASG